VTCVDPRAEPTRYYYWPLVGRLYRTRLRMALDALGPGPFDRLLEVAHGSGIFLPSLAPLCRELHGIDLHPHLGTVRETLRKAGVEAVLETGDALAMPYPAGHFDAVVNISMLEHLRDPRAAVAEMLRVLRPGGTLVLGFPGKNLAMNTFFKTVGFNPDEIHPSSHRDILRAIESTGVPFTARRLPRGLPADWALYFCCRLAQVKGAGA
jgi:ubiquinone/menaquinone biosynthesis C-methylase UbiE